MQKARKTWVVWPHRFYFRAIIFLATKELEMEKNTEAPDHKAVADMVLQRALVLLEARGVPLDIAVDRFTSMAAAAHVDAMGSTLAARCFRDYAKRIAGGLFSKAGPLH